MGLTKKRQLEEAEEEYARRLAEYERDNPDAELDMEDAEALQWALDKDD